MFQRLYTPAERAKRVKQQHKGTRNILIQRNAQIILKEQFKKSCSTHMYPDDNVVLLQQWVENVENKFETLPQIDHFRRLRIAISSFHDSSKAEYYTWRKLKILVEQKTLYKFLLPVVPSPIDRPVLLINDYRKLLTQIIPTYYPANDYDEENEYSDTAGRIDADSDSGDEAFLESLNDVQQQQKEFRFFEANDRSELLKKAEKLWQRRQRSSRIVANIGTDSIQSHSFNTLKPSCQLNDEIISFYMVLLNKREKEKMDTQSFFFSPFFATKLFFDNGRYDFAAVERWTKNILVTNYNTLFFPIFIGHCHWTLIVMFMLDKTIAYYDSMNGNAPDFLMKGFLKWLEDECNAKRANRDVDTTEENWKFINKKHIPQQNNGIDCGLYVIMNADFLSDGVPVTPKTYSSDHMQNFREKIAADILRCSLSYGIAIDASGSTV